MATVAVKQERNNKALAAIITIGIHALLLLFFILYIIITPIPPFPEPPGGAELELDFGNGVVGTGNVEAPNIGNNPSTPTKTTQTSPPNPTKAADPVVTNDVEAAATVNNSKKTTTNPVKVDTVKPQPQMSIELASSLNKFKTAKGASGGNGNSGQKGNAGNPNGSLPGTNMGTGGGPGGPGSGVGSPDFKLSGRQLIHRPNLVTNNPQQGQIVVGITVDQDGNVTEATPGVLGTTINDGALYKNVQDAAMKTKFNKSSNDTPEQYGTITFKFVLQ